MFHKPHALQKYEFNPVNLKKKAVLVDQKMTDSQQDTEAGGNTFPVLKSTL